MDRLTAAYLLLDDRDFSRKTEAAREILRDCVLCPRDCHVDRTSGEKGSCGVLDRPVVASWGQHFGEESPLTGTSGSGTIFFAGCNLGCVFCQNWSISQKADGAEMAEGELASLMLELQGLGCHNINLVTPTHQVPMILGALGTARQRGLSLPLVYNCGGYEALDTVKLLEGVVDIYMPDIKYFEAEPAAEYSDVADYPKRSMDAVKEMHRQVGDLVTDEAGIALRGLLVRHLVLPGGLAGTEGVVRFVAEEISKDTYINIMDQYHPCYRAHEHPPLERRITPAEYKSAVKAAIDAGLRRIDGVRAWPGRGEAARRSG